MTDQPLSSIMRKDMGILPWFVDEVAKLEASRDEWAERAGTRTSRIIELEKEADEMEYRIDTSELAMRQFEKERDDLKARIARTVAKMETIRINQAKTVGIVQPLYQDGCNDTWKDAQRILRAEGLVE